MALDFVLERQLLGEIWILSDSRSVVQYPDNWRYRHPPARSWYLSEGPGAATHFKGDRKDQTALTRLTSGHLKPLRFSRGDKKLNICTKCNMIGATPQHLLDCVALVYDDLFKRLHFVLEVMKANDLMDLI
ncbi:hypothetical protein AVEN_116544-1 [Araneus ventricosus]|uniref:Uncharacterized protein n=1 Tax=Araneus ventricosus TaxID=182803 RepID=A0A4Y2KN56_ARAVE|nr:hypothetical protein AVEN_116544-1 [Araneus ventricosus]